MEYLGEFLSPQNSISQDQDKLTKYFYFRPDKYDNPDADLENIFIIKSMEEFPQRLDRLAENNEYAIESIEVSKRVTDEDSGVKNVSYVVTATYDLLENITKRENSGGGGSASTESSSVTVYVDEDDNKIVGQILPWKQRAQWSFQPIETVVPFKKAYGLDGEYTETPNVDVLNTANCSLLAETVNYQLEITYQKNYRDPQVWEQIMKPYTNETSFDLRYDYSSSFPSGTLLILPPTYSCQWTEIDRLDEDGKPEKDDDGNIIKDIVKYYSYTVKMVYNPKGHNKELLNIGTMAKFGGPLPYEQIYQVTVTNESGTILNGYPKYTSASDALREHQLQSKAGNVVSVEAVSEPLPLTATGGIDYAAMRDPRNNPYVTRSFIQYARRDFNSLPFKN